MGSRKNPITAQPSYRKSSYRSSATIFTNQSSNKSSIKGSLLSSIPTQRIGDNQNPLRETSYSNPINGNVNVQNPMQIQNNNNNHQNSSNSNNLQHQASITGIPKILSDPINPIYHNNILEEIQNCKDPLQKTERLIQILKKNDNRKRDWSSKLIDFSECRPSNCSYCCSHLCYDTGNLCTTTSEGNQHYGHGAYNHHGYPSTSKTHLKISKSSCINLICCTTCKKRPHLFCQCLSGPLYQSIQAKRTTDPEENGKHAYFNYCLGSFLGLPIGCLPWFGSGFVINLRQKIRERHNIAGSYVRDFVSSLFCMGNFMSAQLYREMDVLGYPGVEFLW